MNTYDDAVCVVGLRKRGPGLACLLAVLLGSCAASRSEAGLVVAPNALATTEGNAVNPIPTTAFRFMQIFDAGQFAGLGGPILITHITFRPDASQAAAASQTFTEQILLSTTTQTVAGLSTVFATNVGVDNTSVFNGTVIGSTANLPGSGTAKQFDIVIPFTTPFLYDPGSGNLLVDLRLTSASSPGLRLDAVTGSAVTRAIFGNSASATTGVVVPGTITQFTFQAVPEPSTFALTLAAGGCGLAGWPRRRRGN